MQISLDTKPFASLETDALVTYVFENGDLTQGRPAELDKLTGGMLSRLSKSGELTGKSLETTLLHAPAGFKAARLLLVGAGKREQFNPATLRKVAGASLRYLKARAAHKVVFLVRESDSTEEVAQAVTESAIVADFETDKSRAAASSPTRKILRATSSTNLPTNSRPKFLPKKPKLWPRKPGWPWKSSTRKKSPR
jgi:leucyl aminopeptidase